MSVSVVIPVYNGARWLGECIDSALAQGDVVSELVVVDDGSTDNSAAIALAHADSRVRLCTKDNGGAASARNLGIENAQGRFIAFLDADDLWRPNKLAQQLPLLEQRKELGVVTGLMKNFWMTGLESEAEENPELKRPQPGVASTFVARKAIFNDCGLLDTEFRERDIQEWIVRVKRSGWEHALVDQIVVDRRIHDANHSRIRKPGEEELLGLANRLLKARREKKAAEGD